MLREGQVVMFGPRDEVLAALQKAQAESQGLPAPAQAQPQPQASRSVPSTPTSVAASVAAQGPRPAQAPGSNLASGKPEAPQNVSLNTSGRSATYTTAPVPSLSTLTQAAQGSSKKPTTGGQS